MRACVRACTHVCMYDGVVMIICVNACFCMYVRGCCTQMCDDYDDNDDGDVPPVAPATPVTPATPAMQCDSNVAEHSIHDVNYILNITYMHTRTHAT